MVPRRLEKWSKYFKKANYPTEKPDRDNIGLLKNSKVTCTDMHVVLTNFFRLEDFAIKSVIFDSISFQSELFKNNENPIEIYIQEFVIIHRFCFVHYYYYYYFECS